MRDAVDHTRVAFCRDGAGEKPCSVVRQEMEETLRNFHVDLEIKIRSTALHKHAMTIIKRFSIYCSICF